MSYSRSLKAGFQERSGSLPGQCGGVTPVGIRFHLVAECMGGVGVATYFGLLSLLKSGGVQLLRLLIGRPRIPAGLMIQNRRRHFLH